MGYRVIGRLTLICFVVASAQACAGKQAKWDSPGQCIAAYTGGGAVAGALTGAAVGLIRGKKVAESALVGGGTGAALAFAYAWGACFASFSQVESAPVEGYQEAANAVGYRSGQGLVVNVDDFALIPAAVQPGETVKLNATYFVLDAPERKEIKVTESRSVSIWNPEKNSYVDSDPYGEEITIALGRRLADGKIEIPSDLPEGKYKITFVVSSEDSTSRQVQASKEAFFEVTRDQQTLARARQEAFGTEKRFAQARAKSANRAESYHVASSAVALSGEKGLASPQRLLRVTASELMVRDAPTQSGVPIGKVSKGGCYPWSEERAGWFRIQTENGESGWVSGKYVTVE